MFWKTCLTHAGEILLALGGAGLLGYLWSKWFAVKEPGPDPKEYEDQIFTLREKIKDLDKEIKSAHTLRDQTSDRTIDLENQISILKSDLANKNSYSLDQINTSVDAHISSEDAANMQLALQRNLDLSADRDRLANAFKELELKWNLAKNDSYQIQKLETLIVSKDETIHRLESEVKQGNDKLTDLESTVYALNDQITELDRHYQNLQEKLNQQINLLELKIQEGTTQPIVMPSALEEEFKILTDTNTEFQNHVSELQSKIHYFQTDLETADLKLMHADEKNRQLALDLANAQEDIKNFQIELKKSDQLKKENLEILKSKQEWEARWKEASQDAEQIKIAYNEFHHASELNKSEVASLISELTVYKSNEESLQNKLLELTESFNHQMANWDHKYNALNDQLGESQKQLSEASEYNHAAHTALSDWDRKYNALVDQLAESQKHLSEASEYNHTAHASLSEWERKYNSLNDQLAESQKHLSEASEYNHTAHGSLSEWENKYNSLNDQLAESQKHLSEASEYNHTAHASLSEWERKYNSLNDQLAESQKHLSEASEYNHTAHASLSEWERKYNSLNDQLAESQKHLSEASEYNHTAHASLSEWERKYNSLNDQLAESQKHLSEASEYNHTAHASLSEWERKYNSLNDQLAESQKHLSEASEYNHTAHASLSEWERKYNSLNDQLAESQKHLSEASEYNHTAHTSLTEWERKYGELLKKFNETQKHLTEASDYNFNAHKSLGEWEQKNNILNQKLTEVQNQLINSEQKLQNLDLDNEWERRYNESNAKLADTQDQLENIESINASLQNELENIAIQYKIQLELLADQGIKNDLVQISADQAAAEKIAMDSKYQELTIKFNTVQLKLADMQRNLSHLDANKKSKDDWKLKYEREAKAWLNKISELEKDIYRKEMLFEDKLAKEMKANIKQTAYLKKELEGLKKIKEEPAKNRTTEIILKSPENQKTRKLSRVKLAIPIKSDINWKEISLLIGKKTKQDDLKIIEGIGPKISNLLKREKLLTWSAISKVPVNRIQKILDKGGDKYKLANPATWPLQAKLAADGRWQELKTYQDTLTGGIKDSPVLKTPVSQSATKTRKENSKKLNFTKAKATAKPKFNESVIALKERKKIEPGPKSRLDNSLKGKLDLVAAKEIFNQKIKLDDLKIIEGIGPKIALELRKAKINSWSKLSKVSSKSIKEILDKSDRFHLADPSTWPAQAKLASNGLWKRLKTFQDKLNGGRKE